MFGRDRIERSHPQRIEIQGLGFLFFPIDLVDHIENGLGRFAQNFGKVPISGEETFPPVHQKKNQVGFPDRLFHLMEDLLLEEGLGFGIESPGIDEDKGAIFPRAFGINPIPRHPRQILHDRLALSGHPVKKSGFPHVRPADDGKNRFHKSPGKPESWGREWQRCFSSSRSFYSFLRVISIASFSPRRFSFSRISEGETRAGTWRMIFMVKIGVPLSGDGVALVCISTMLIP